MFPKFFANILGVHGYSVMETFVKSSESLGSYVFPRIVVSWLRQSNYGEIKTPSLCPLSKLIKSGYGYSGVADIDGISYSFDNSTEEHVAAIVAVASNQKIDIANTKDIDLAKLAKSIDALVKMAPKAPANQYEHTSTASNIQPDEPIAPTATEPNRVQTKSKKTLRIPKLKRPFDLAPKPLKITKSESQKKCGVCGQKMFDNDTFTGCICFRPLAKNVKTNVLNDSLRLTFDDTWDQEAYLTLVEVFKNGR